MGMNQIVNVEDLVSALPIKEEPRPMTRKEKLMRWAKLVRESTNHRLYIFHRLEHMDDMMLRAPTYFVANDSTFGIAMMDPVFSDLGLKGEPHILPGQETGTIRQAMDFFELTRDQLHEFSCDCGGRIDNEMMATRIEGIADRS
jgi:hypothetical protein